MADNTEEGFYNINDLDESFNGSLSDSEIIINCKHSKLKKINKINKINSEEEIIVYTQFTGFGDDGNELRKPCSVKINTRPEDTQKWIESFREKMIEIYDLEERPVQHGYQFALYKNGSKYVSATIYNTGTMLVQGLGTCLDWKNKHYAELRALIGQRNIIALNSSETDLKQIISLNKELTTTTPIVENSEQETGEAIENGNLTPLATDIANISIQMKNINDRFDQISTESKQFKEINSELENQIVQLKACLKIEQQNCKSLQDEIVIKDKKIKIQQDEIKNLQTTVTKLSTKPAQKTITTSICPSKSFTSGISSTSTPVSRKSTVEQLKPKQKNQLKLRNNQKKTGNVLIIGSSITKDINTKTLKENATVNTNRGGTTTSLKKHIEDLDLTPFNSVILQIGGNDADRDIEIHDFNRNYMNIIQEIQKCNEVKHIVVGGIVPRTKKNTEKYNKELNSICRQENIDFVNHSENFLLKNGKIVNGLLYSDGVHLTYKQYKRQSRNPET